MKFILQSSDRSAVSGADGVMYSLADTIYDALLEESVACAIGNVDFYLFDFIILR